MAYQKSTLTITLSLLCTLTLPLRGADKDKQSLRNRHGQQLGNTAELVSLLTDQD